MARNVPFRIVRKLVSVIERKRSYRLRDEIWKYSFETASRGKCVFLIVAGAGYLSDAAWAAASFLTNSATVAQDTRLIFCLEGVHDDRSCALLQETFPKAEIVSTGSLLKLLGLPRLERFAGEHPLGGKLAALTYFNQNNTIFYSDSDVLAFSLMGEIDAALSDATAVFMTQKEECYDGKTAESARQQGYSLPKGLNSGLLVLPAGTVDPALLENLILEPVEIDSKSSTWWWIEQTIIAAIMGGCGGIPLPIGSYVASMQRQLPFETDVNYDAISVRHFVSPVRHLMYAKGIPIILKKFASRWRPKRV